MALKAKHNETDFGVGDSIKVFQRIKEGQKERVAAFEGMVIAIKGRDLGKTITVRRIGAQMVGIEKIFPLHLPTIEKIEVLRVGHPGTRHAKLYFTRNKSRREKEKIYSRAFKKQNAANTKTEEKSVSKKSKKSATASK